MAEAIRFLSISIKSAERLSSAFHSIADPDLSQDRDISEFLKGLIAYIGRCSMCHGVGTVNFEQANGWDEPCPKCGPGVPS